MKSQRFSFVLAVVGMVFAAVVTGSQAAIVVPNASVNDEITFNLGDDAWVFDKSVGPLGSLVDIPGSPGSGAIDGYPGGYTFDLDITAPLTADLSGTQGDPNQAIGLFESVEFWLRDMENGGALLLHGQIDGGSFMMMEVFYQALYSVGELPFTVDTVDPGSLGPWFADTGRLVMHMGVQSPSPNFENFNYDILATGTVTLITDEVVPEPASCLLLCIGAGLALRRRRR